MDIKLGPDGGCFDLFIENDDFVADNGLETAVVISLFSNRRVTPEQLPDLITDRQGWWGDMIADVEGDQIGSRLWTLERSKRTVETLRLFEDYTREALDWMIEDGIANEISVTAEYDENGKLVASLRLVRPNDVDARFSVLWDEQAIKAG